MGLYEKLVAGEEKLSLVGLGYVGMPIAVDFARKIRTEQAREAQMASKKGRSRLTSLMAPIMVPNGEVIASAMTWSMA